LRAPSSLSSLRDFHLRFEERHQALMRRQVNRRSAQVQTFGSAHDVNDVRDVTLHARLIVMPLLFDSLPNLAGQALGLPPPDHS
jgi:hypothetical protein